ncbi:hypothetical protein F5Y16DRAFT_332490 [Xylariaceae sp. FL0255]|nr:hypothetical protein F5Y16DRAFT_332490 [Xylariaceae sp. FL0255]
MGKQDSNNADAVSLRSNPGPSSASFPYQDRIENDDAPELNIDDLPPAYSDTPDEASEAAPMLPPNRTPATAVRPDIRPRDHDALVVIDVNTGAQGWVARSLENPPDLENYIRQLATVPPRPFLKLVGTHHETRRDSKGKTEKVKITDFDVSIEMTPYLYSDAQYRKSWSELRTVENHEKVRRGTVIRKRAPGSRQDIEVGGPPQATLQEWCHRFSASHAGLKCFTLSRQIVGFDFETVKRHLESMVRDTNYRGHVTVEMVVKDGYFELYNDAKINRWRLTGWIKWLFFLTFLWIFSWPYLFFRTKRWEVAVVDWPFSRTTDAGLKEYVSISEDQWYNMWARAICRAVLEKRQKVLDQADLRSAHEPNPAFDTGNQSVDGALGLFRAGMHAMNEVNRQLGWGGDC